MPFRDSTDSLPGGTRRAADRRTMRDSPSRNTLGLPRATPARMARRSDREEKEGRGHHANPKRLTSRDHCTSSPPRARSGPCCAPAWPPKHLEEDPCIA